MKKPNFNQPKQLNVFKMSCEELDKMNKEMMGELKKIPLNKPPSGNKRTSQSPAVSKSSINMSPVFRPPQNRTNDSMVIKDSANITTKKSLKEHLMTQFERTNTNGNDNGNTTPKRDKTFEYKIVKKDKMLIPMESPDQVKNMRICEKMLLPNEKNYFVSEKNFKLIAEAINQKEINIQSLKILLDLAKADLKSSNGKFTALIEENELLHKKNEEMTLENVRLRTEIADMTIQFNKMLSINQKVIALIAFINEHCGAKSGADISISRKVNDKMIELDLIDVLRPIHDTKLATHVNGGSSLDQNEVLCKKYLKKLIDAEKHIADLTKITEEKFDSLSDVSKEMVQAKIRIKELNDINEKLEQDNAYLRLNCQNNYMENPMKHNDNLNEAKVLNSKLEELNKTISGMKGENTSLQKQLEQSKLALSQFQSQAFKKESEANQFTEQLASLQEKLKEKDDENVKLNSKLDHLSESLKEKEDVITELKSRIADYERAERNEKSERRRITPNDSCSIKSPQSSKRNFYPNESRNDDEFTEYLNKSTDDCLKELDKQRLAKKSSRNLELSNTSMSNDKGTAIGQQGTRNVTANNIYSNNNKKAKMKEEKKDLEIKILKEKVASLENEEKNIYFEGENEEIGVNGVTYIGDLFLHLCNQARLIEKMIE